MTDTRSPSGGYRNDRLRNERDPQVDEKQPSREGQPTVSPDAEMPEARLGANEMSKAWARESYRADYARVSSDTRNDFGTKRVEGDEVDKPD